MLFEGAEQLFVIFDAECRVHSALQQELVATESKHLLGFADIFVERSYVVAVGLVGFAVEVAETTPRHADICSVYIAVNLPSHNIGVCDLCCAQAVGLRSQLV